MKRFEITKNELSWKKVNNSPYFYAYFLNTENIFPNIDLLNSNIIIDVEEDSNYIEYDILGKTSLLIKSVKKANLTLRVYERKQPNIKTVILHELDEVNNEIKKHESDIETLKKELERLNVIKEYLTELGEKLEK